jgi:hypothetical protein
VTDAPITLTVQEDGSLSYRTPDSSGTVMQRCTTLTARIPGDCNDDGELDVSDATCIVGVLFLGVPEGFPCGGGGPLDRGNIALLDWQPDGRIDVSDGVGVVRFLFSGRPPHPLADRDDPSRVRVAIPDCP